MTNKQLNFIVSGMLAEERKVAEKRIAYIFSRLNDTVIDAFTDGIVTNVNVVDESALLEYVRSRNKSKTIVGFESWSKDEDRTDVEIRLNVKVKRIVYGKPEEKAWETVDTPDDAHSVKTETTWAETIYIHPGSQIPGVEYTVL